LYTLYLLTLLTGVPLPAFIVRVQLLRHCVSAPIPFPSQPVGVFLSFFILSLDYLISVPSSFCFPDLCLPTQRSFNNPPKTCFSMSAGIVYLFIIAVITKEKALSFTSVDLLLL
jgi:hypothetical protein